MPIYLQPILFKALLAITIISHASDFAQPADNFLVGGAPSPLELEQLAEQGIGHVIDLRAERPEDRAAEQAKVEALGMQYHHIPIAGSADFTAEKVATFDALLREVATDGALLHCASGNRVGALAALRAGWIKGYSDEEALAIGERWGLTVARSAVADLLATTPRPDDE